MGTGEEIVSMLGTRGNADGDADESRIQAELTQTPISLTSVASKLDGHFKPRVPSTAVSAASILSDGGSLAVRTPVGLRLALLV